MAGRTVVMPDGQIINNVPSDITDDQVKGEYFKQQNDKLAGKAGYDVNAARAIGFTNEQQINQYLKGHPRYDVEQKTRQDVSAMPWWQKQLEGVKAAVQEGLTGIQQIPSEMTPGNPVDTAMRGKAATAEATSRGVREGGGGPGYYATGVAKQLALMAAGRVAGPSAFRMMTGGGTLMERQGGAGIQGLLSGLTQPVSGEDESKLNAVLTNMAFSVGGQAAVDAFRAAPFAFKQQVASGINLLAQQGLPSAETERTILSNIARDKFGMEIPAAEASGSPVLKTLQSLGRAIPFGSANENRMITKNARQADVAALRSMGASGNVLNGESLSNAADDIGGRLDMIGGKQAVKLGPNYVRAIGNALQSYSQLNTADPETVKLLRQWLDPTKLTGAKPVFKGTAGTGYATMSADQLLKERSNLAKQAAADDKAGNWQQSDARNTIIDAIDNAITLSLPKNQQGMYNEARDQYRNYRIIRRAYDEKAGDIVPGRLSQALRASYGDSVNAIPSGQNDLVDLSRVMNIFGIKEPRPGQMSGYIKGVTGGGSAMIGAGIGGAGGPVGMGTGAVLGLGLPPILTNAASSSRLGRYMTNPMTEQQARALAVLIRSQTGGLGLMTPLNAPPNQ